ncbi:hypothetical protein [Spongiactinospora sp. TRM90649]|uniref:hypothetical protein n=1 Tax=Spongiactinospora sp. TRM90649 TaxID=3031114 RepID=UPI0023F8FA27|nr:hypothetical protein [Spongiactinospora sp. TRM90649]MDF5755569.1 hypothetical protein [Spongiactinospora sp. TRM90649]
MTLGQEYLEALSGLRPIDISTYLTNGGWQDVDVIGRSQLWVFDEDDKEFEVLLPGDTAIRDYVPRMLSLFQTLSEIEQRPQSEILRDVTATGVDSQHFTTYPEGPPGTTSVADAVDAYEGLRWLYLSGAYAVDGEPRLVLPNRKSRVVEEFPRQVRLRPPRDGSYVISAEVPLALRPPEGALFSLGLPFARRVLLRLYDTIRTAKAAAAEASETSDLSPFTDRVGEGISITLCRALALFGGADRDRPFKLQFSWASTLPTGVRTSPIRFSEPEVAMLTQAEEDLGQQRHEEEWAHVTGTIFKLERATPEAFGWAVIDGVATVLKSERRGRRRRIWVSLHGDDYSAATRAHDFGLRVSMRGLLVRTASRTQLEEVGNFRVLEHG